MNKKTSTLQPASAAPLDQAKPKPAASPLLYTVDVDYRLQFVNDAAIHLAGGDPTGRVCHQALFGRQAVCPWCPAFPSSPGHSQPIEFEHPDGGRVYAGFHTGMPGVNGDLLRWVLLNEVSEQKAAWDALSSSNAHMRSIFLSDPRPLLILENFTLREANPSAVRILGLGGDTPPDITRLRDPQGEDLGQFLRRSLPAGCSTPQSGLEWSMTLPDGGPVLYEITVICYQAAGAIRMLLALHDTTKHRRTEQALRQSEQRFAQFMDFAPAGVFIKDNENRVVYVNAYMKEHFGAESWIGRKTLEVFPNEIGAAMTADDENAMSSGYQKTVEALPHPDGIFHYYETQKFRLVLDESSPPMLGGIALDITEYKHITDDLHSSSERMQALLELNQMTGSGLQEIASFAMEAAVRLTGSDIGYLAFTSNDESLLTMYAWSQNAMRQCLIIDKPIEYMTSETGLWGEAIRQRRPVITNDYTAPNPHKRGLPEGHVPIRRHMNVPVFSGDRIVLVAGVGNKHNDYDEVDVQQLTLLMEGMWSQVERNRKQEELANRLKEIEAVNRISSQLRMANSVSELLNLLLDETLNAIGAEQGSIWMYEPASNHLRQTVWRGIYSGFAGRSFPATDGLLGEVFLSREMLPVDDFTKHHRFNPAASNVLPEGLGGCLIPLMAGSQPLGVLVVGVPSSAPITPDQLRFLHTLAEMAGNSLQRVLLYDQAQLQLTRLSALRTIDMTISSSHDLKFSMTTLISQVIKELGVDAADVLVLNPHTMMLETCIGQGFQLRHPAVQLRMGESEAGKAAMERRTVMIQDLSKSINHLTRGEMLDGEGFQAYIAVPLLAKSQVKGVLRILHRERLEPESEWMDFMEMLAGQAAIAIDNAEMFEGLKRSHTDLSIAYDTTLEGWARALELRDVETQGHSQRVTDMTMQLATNMRIKGVDLVNLRRGALLHDIGKMSIPDHILFKPGPLTEDEWLIMRRHPEFACNLIQNVPYLHPAMDIPMYHHEKWDGTGYPHGLRGQQIPLTARIFSVVDVWDALRSDRPYRKAWGVDQTIHYIREQSGKHFDPNVVTHFLKLV